MRQWAWMVGQFNQRTLRERVMISAALLASIWCVWLFSLGDPIASDKARVERNIANLAMQLKASNDQHEAMLALDAPEIISDLHLRRSALQRAAAEIDAELNRHMSRFVDPKAVPEVLRAVLKDHAGIELISLDTLPAELVEDGIYRYPISVQVRGSYPDVLAYLEALEDLPSELGWRRLDYVVENHPLGIAEVQLETLKRSDVTPPETPTGEQLDA